MKCPKCNKTYDDDFKFCPYCGEEKPEPKICPNCEMEVSLEFSFCPECGTKLVSKSSWEELNKLNEQIREYERLGEYKKAFECIDKAIEIDSSNQSLLRIKEEILQKQVIYLKEQAIYLKERIRYEEALEFIEKAIEIDSSNQSLLRIKEEILQKQGIYLKELIKYTDKFRSTSKELREEIINDINNGKITSKSQIRKRAF